MDFCAMVCPYATLVDGCKRCAEVHNEVLHSQFTVCSLQCDLPDKRIYSATLMSLCPLLLSHLLDFLIPYARGSRERPS